jgi:hypothetical protein
MKNSKYSFLAAVTVTAILTLPAAATAASATVQ